MRRAAILILILTFLSKAIGFLRDIVLSWLYGAGGVSDAYLVSYTIPGVVFALIGIGIATSYVPLYHEIDTNAGDREAVGFTNRVINILMLLGAVIISLCLVFIRPIVGIIASGFDGETLRMAVDFTRITIFGVFFSMAIYILTGYLNVKGRFLVPVSVGILFNAVITLSIVLSKSAGIYLLPAGLIAALAIQLLVLFLASKRHGFHYRPTVRFKDGHVGRLAYLSIPVIIGASVNQLNVLIDRTLASRIAVGGISALSYSNKLVYFTQGLFVTSLTTVMFVAITRMVAAGDLDGTKKTLRETINGVNLFLVPVTVGAIVFAKPVVQLLFGRGSFDERAVAMTSSALLFYAIGMLGLGLRDVLSRVFYAMQDTRTPMVNAAYGVAINIVLNLVLSRFMGIGGLALATSVAALVTSGLMFISLRKRIGPCGIRLMLATMMKITASSALMGIAAALAYEFLKKQTSQNTALVLAVMAGAVLYAVLIYFLKIEEVASMIRLVKTRLLRME